MPVYLIALSGQEKSGCQRAVIMIEQKRGLFCQVSAEQIILDLSAPAKQKCDFCFAYKINGLQPSILVAHPCATGIAD